MTKPKPMSIERLEHMNWIKRLEWAIAYVDKTDNALDYALESYLNDMAESWPSCAVGKLCNKLPRDPQDLVLPKDNILQKWGRDFYWEITELNYKAALKVYYKIEKRTAMLLNKMQEKKK